jgi:hypothetical protein
MDCRELTPLVEAPQRCSSEFPTGLLGGGVMLATVGDVHPLWEGFGSGLVGA